MTKSDVQFQIDQLRKDKIIYAIEACAVSLLCIFYLLFIFPMLESPYAYIIGYLLALVASGYTIFMGVGNFFRLKRIRKLEKNLYSYDK